MSNPLDDPRCSDPIESEALSGDSCPPVPKKEPSISTRRMFLGGAAAAAVVGAAGASAHPKSRILAQIEEEIASAPADGEDTKGTYYDKAVYSQGTFTKTIGYTKDVAIEPPADVIGDDIGPSALA